MRRRREATVDDLYRVGEDVKAELVNGELVTMTPGGGLHGRASGAIFASLLDYERRTADFVEGAPIFAVEVRSKDEFGPAAERARAIERQDYFAAGAGISSRQLIPNL